MESDDEIFDTSALTLSGDFETQVQELLERVRLTRDEVEGLQLLFNDLQETLQHLWKGCRIHAFGSIVTGLGIRTSDVDCFVDVPRWEGDPAEILVRRARSILQRRPEIFAKVFAIVGAKVPIVKFYHLPTSRNCDISFTSPAGVENSKLIAYLLQSDKRILPLSVIIKYWSKVHNLTGTNLMPNYALTLLVIFYLQQRAALPPVSFLQTNVQVFLINDWNVAFNTPLHSNTNKDSLFQLLSGFFNYYSTFDYEKYVISPYLGYKVEKKLFSNVRTVPDDFYMYKNNVDSNICKPLRLNSLMCVQDPFEHNRNCSVAIYPKLANAIIMHFNRAAQTPLDDGYLRTILTKLDLPANNAKRKRPNAFRGVGKHKKNQKFTQNFKSNIRLNKKRLKMM